MGNTPHRHAKLTLLAIVSAIVAFMMFAPACGHVHTYGGIEHSYDYDFDGNYKPKKPKKPKKHKKDKHHDNGNHYGQYK